ncbi:MAG: extracellular solute-binding protein [Oscillospiraceae bacterium]|nr:extracellular solute-binding protein [Oscillospiraceae bacterium]
MINYKKALAALTAVCMTASLAACGAEEDNGGHGYLLEESEVTTTTQMTVAINTETLAPEQEEKVATLADSLTGELENKKIKWMSFYDPWHPTGQGNTKPVSVELFEKKYGGEIEYYPTTWATQFDELSTSILGGEGIDFFPAPEAIPKCVISGMTQNVDGYIDWSNPLWSSVKDINDQFAVGDGHYLMVCEASAGYVVYYNRSTIEAFGFDDPADLYANGEWTMDKFKEMLLEFVDVEADQYGLDGWFNCTPLMLAFGVPSVSLKDGKLVNNLSDPNFERAMEFQYDLNRNGLILDKSLFSWNPQIQYIGEGKELFYIGGLYEIESAPDIWTKTFGEIEDVFFVPVPKDAEADKYYYNAELDCYNLCVGAQNPEGVIKLMECVIAAHSDPDAQEIDNEKHKADYGWTDEMIEMRAEVERLTQENPVRDVYGGLSSDLSSLISDSINQPIQGTDWYTVKESIYDTVELQIEEINGQLAAIS